MTWHKDATPPDVHIPYAWTYANQTARESATGLEAADVGKFARQTDDDTIWMLIDESPVTWKFIGGGVGADTFLGLADTPNTYAGDGGKVVAVKGTADGLEFVDLDLSEIIDHIDSTAIHFFETDIDHRNIQYIGTYTHDEIDTHIDDGTIHFTESNISHENIQDIGTNTHDDIDAHIADATSNPHMVTLSDVGGAPVVHTHVEADITDLDHDAVKIQGVPVDDSAIADGKVLVYDSTTGDLQYEFIEGGGGEFNPEYQQATSEGESSTTSETYQLKLRLTTSSLPSGTYIIQWNYEIDGNGDHAESRVELNDTTELGFNRYDSSLNGYISVSGFALRSLSGVNTIDIDYRTVSSPDDVDIRRARLALWRVS